MGIYYFCYTTRNELRRKVTQEIKKIIIIPRCGKICVEDMKHQELICHDRYERRYKWIMDRERKKNGNMVKWRIKMIENVNDMMRKTQTIFLNAHYYRFNVEKNDFTTTTDS